MTLGWICTPAPACMFYGAPAPDGGWGADCASFPLSCAAFAAMDPKPYATPESSWIDANGPGDSFYVRLDDGSTVIWDGAAWICTPP
jgi:hypothetical protein